MGVVYRAHDERLDRDVALKVLPTGTLADEAVRKRFHKEARALSKLNHPNIATVHDFDTQDGTDFLVMEFIPGVTLSDKLAGGPLPEKEILRIGSQLAEGLSAAHEQNIIHRDLKPGNLRIMPDGRLKILDFGLAKLVHPLSESDLTASVSETHAVAGTLPYMAPEQLQGAALDARTDIYAAGVVLYEMVTGRRPFEEKLSTTLTDAILHRAPAPPTSYNHRISPALEGIILKSLEKEPERRYQSARDLLADFLRLSAPSGAVLRVRPRRRYARWVMGASIALVVIVAGLFALNVGNLRDRALGRTSAPPIRSLAVLPLTNLSGDPEQEYFADGMTEALIAELTKIRELKVISRTSVMQYKGAKRKLPQIARDLEVDGVVEGSVVREGNQVRIIVQLIEGKTDRHLWADSYQREMSSVLALQSSVAQAIAAEIKITLSPEEKTRLTNTRLVNPEAYDAYLKGRQFWTLRTKEGLEKSVEYFQRSVQIDPEYALGYAGLADAYLILGYNRFLSPQETYPKAKVAVRKALELDNSLAEAHTTQAGIFLSYDWDWSGAEREYRRALALKPGYAFAHQFYAHFLSYVGRFDESIKEIKIARALDPLSPGINANVGFFLYLARRYGEAIQELQSALELYPELAATQAFLSFAYSAMGLHEQAIAAAEAAVRGGWPGADFELARALALAGKRQQAKLTIEKALRMRRRYISSVDLAFAYGALGEKAQAFAILEKAYAERNSDLVRLRVAPLLDPLRNDPRFQNLLRRMNFPQ